MFTHFLVLRWSGKGFSIFGFFIITPILSFGGFDKKTVLNREKIKTISLQKSFPE